jgi:HD superfamily phosphohydrolase
MGDGWKQRVRDPVHGLIMFGGRDPRGNETDRIAWRLLNTKEFQRLRRIRQLGFSDMVYPGATHSRFAHSIGVYHVARRLLDVIAREQGAKHDRDRARVALLAALLHDLGHGPFSHAFENVARTTGLPKRHEDWSAEIVRGDTDVNRVLREVDEQLPEQVGALLKEEEAKDVYAAVVSSQFDADRIDYIQRDRMMTGVQFGHVDSDWLLDCLEVGSVTIGEQDYVPVQCLYLGPKGIGVAEEYLEARFRLYWTVYMHKTTRAAEKMLEALLEAAASALRESDVAGREPILRYLTSETRSLDAYLRLDDAAIWAALAEYADCRNPRIADLASRLRDRHLYKCLEIGSWDEPQGNLYLRFRRELQERQLEWLDDLLFDQSTITPYTWYDFDDDASALSKVLVKVHSEMNEPKDIAEESPIVKALRDEKLGRVQRVYAPDKEKVVELDEILKEMRR